MRVIGAMKDNYRYLRPKNVKRKYYRGRKKQQFFAFDRKKGT
jgi:hypothetical protein